ncbi:MAG: translocation/assembly module TamB domain-containing protein [Armatimonadota bacterium]|nr:translocation/assembly module TamB domain-containing protein [Armatimonadota bacterium]
MTKRLLTLVLLLAATIALLAEAGRSVTTPQDRWREWLQLLTAQQIADTLGRQVRLGPVSDLGLDGVEVTDLAVAGGTSLAEGAVMRADRIRIDFDLVGMARGEVAPAAGIDRVRVEGAWLHAIRDEAGELNLQKILPEAKPAPPEERFRGVVEVADSAVVYEDYAVPTARGGPLNLELVEIDAEVDMRRLGWARIEATGRERLGKVGSVDLLADVETDSGFAWAQASIDGIDAAWWYATFAPTQDVVVERAWLSVDASVGVMPGDDGQIEPSVSGQVRLRDAAVRVGPLGGRRVEAEADATVTTDGVEVHWLRAHSGGTRVEASGFVGDPQDPVVDLTFDGEVLRPEELLALAPPEVALPEQVENASIAGPLLLSGRLTGPMAAANVSAQVAVPGELRYASAEVGEFTAGPVDLRVDVLDLSSPNVRGRADMGEVVPVDTRPLQAMLPEDVRRPVTIAPLENVTADVLWSAETPVAQTQIALPRAALGEIAVENLSANVAMAGGLLRVSDIYAEPLGATLTADAVVGVMGEDAPWAYLEGELADLDLSRLRKLPGLEATEGLSGTLFSKLAGTYDADGPEVVAHALLARPAWQQYGAESLRGLVIVDENAVQVRGASFQDRLGVGWARGVLPFEGEMAASFAVAGVDLSQVAERFDLEGVEDLRGEGFVSGDVSGTLQRPAVDATVRAFGAGWQDYGVDGMIADISGGLEEVRIERLYASTGRIVARVEGELTEIDLEERDARLGGSVVVGGPVDRHALELAELQERDITGAVRAEIGIGGTLSRPLGRGKLYLDFARHERIATDDAVATITLHGDTLEMDELHLPMGEALVTGQASVILHDTPIVSATVTADNVMLQDLAPLQELGLPLSGRVDLPYLSLEGPADNLRGLGQVEATDVVLGTERIGAVSAVAALDKNAILLQPTSVALAGGTLDVEGRMRLDERRILPSRIELDGVSIARLLRVGVPIARTFADAPAEELAEGQRPLSRRLAALSMRLGGVLGGSLTAEGVLPEIPEGAGSQEAARRVLEGLSGEVNLSVQEATFDRKPLPATSVQARVGEEPMVELSLRASEGDALITADGSWRPDGAIDMLAEVSGLDLSRLRPWMPPGVPSMGGGLNLTVLAEGSVDRPEVTGSVDIIEPEVHGARFDLVSAPIIRYDARTLNIEDLVIRESEEEIYVTGHLPFDWETKSVPPDGPLALEAEAKGTDLGIFPPIIADALAGAGEEPGPIGDVEPTGTLDAMVSIGGTPQQPELNGTVEVTAPSIQTPWLTSPIEDLAVKTELTGGQGVTEVKLARLAARAESTTLEADGEATLSQYELSRLHENRFDLRASISAPRQTFAAGLVGRQVRGTVTMTTAEPGRQLVTIEDLGANFGDGSLTVNGTVGLTSFEPSSLAGNDFDVTIRAAKARPRYSNLFLGTINGTITARNPEPDQPVQITGGMEVSHAVLGVPRPGGGAGEGELQGMSADFPAPELDVRLAIGPDVRVRTTGMAAPLQPTDRAVQMRGTPQRPVVQGLIEVQEGEASIPGGVLDIETGGVHFLLASRLGTRGRKPPVPLDLEGRVWATATRRIEQAMIDGRQMGPIDIDMEVSGTLPDNVHVQASSSPPLAEEQIYALLGMAPFQVAAGAEAAGLQDVMTEQFVTALGAAFRHYVFQPFQEELKQLLGLSVLEVSFAFNQPVSVRLGGYVVEDLLVNYRTSVTGGTETYDVGVSYKVDRRYEVSYRTDETGDNRMFVEYVYQF